MLHIAYKLSQSRPKMSHISRKMLRQRSKMRRIWSKLRAAHPTTRPATGRGATAARPSTICKMEAKRRRNERFRMLAATDPDLLAARHWRLKRRLRKMSNAQREHRSSS